MGLFERWDRNNQKAMERDNAAVTREELERFPGQGGLRNRFELRLLVLLIGAGAIVLYGAGALIVSLFD